MRGTIAVMQRELFSLFYSPIAYIVLCGFLLLTGVLVVISGSFAPGQPASLRYFFGPAPYVLAFIIPGLTMRLISEEYRSGTIEPLMTAPLSDAAMVIGKYLASVAFYAVMLVATLVYLVLMAMFGQPDTGASLASYFGLFLLGASFLAFGLFTSSSSRNQVVAWMLATVPLLLLVSLASYVSTNTGVLRTFLQDVLSFNDWWAGLFETGARNFFHAVNIERHLDQFNKGLVTLEGVTFFLATAALFVFLSIKVVESRRWR